LVSGSAIRASMLRRNDIGLSGTLGRFSDSALCGSKGLWKYTKKFGWKFRQKDRELCLRLRQQLRPSFHLDLNLNLNLNLNPRLHRALFA
jgi:hypothetical protein